jgi:hypothetical protein
LLYAIAGLSTVIVNLQIGQGGPALVGLFAMGPWVVVGWVTPNTKKPFVGHR